MKHVAIVCISTIVTVLVVIILMSVHSKDLRQTELERALKVSARQSLENACLSQKTQINDNDALAADFIKSFLGKMKTDGRVVSENGEVYSADSSDSGQRVERESRRPSEYINYYIPWQAAKEAGFDYLEGEDYLYYQKRFAAGMKVTADIEAPEYKGHSFVRWNEQKENGVTKRIAVYR